MWDSNTIDRRPMNIYYLLYKGGRLAHQFDNPFGTSHRVAVRGKSGWYDARQRALRHAAEAGAAHALIVVGHAEPVLVRRTGVGNSTDRSLLAAEGDHGLLLYLSRLLCDHAGAVLLGPLAGYRPGMAPMEDFHPVMPSIAAYSVPATNFMEVDGPGLEYDLCRSGYRVITLWDYCVQLNGEPTLDTVGSTKSWKAANRNAMGDIL